MTKDEALKQALNVLKGCLEHPDSQDAIDGIEAALAQPEQEPVAFCDPTAPCNETAFSWIGTARKKEHTTPLYTSPPQRKLLTDDEIDGIAKLIAVDDFNYDFARAIEAAHGIKE